ncbi:hypothetical protein ACFL0O_09060, partial [Thermodesulfobacteriota bacterium]
MSTFFTKDLLSDPSERKFYRRIPVEHVLGQECSDQAFEADKGYFEIRVSEIFLRNKREYFRSFIPLAIVLSDFIYDDRRESVPYFVGNQLLQVIEKYIEKKPVEFRSERAIGPVPYMGDDVSLFVG